MLDFPKPVTDLRPGMHVWYVQAETWSSFKCDTTGSDKRIAFRYPCDLVFHDVRVFEAPIDLMSWFSLYGQANAIALCGLHDAPLETYLSDNPHISRIVLCFDNDRRGREAAERLGAKYRERGYGIDDLIPPSGKDWNEYLQSKGVADGKPSAGGVDETKIISGG